MQTHPPVKETRPTRKCRDCSANATKGFRCQTCWVRQTKARKAASSARDYAKNSANYGEPTPDHGGDYSDDECEFFQAVMQLKKTSPFPKLTQILQVFKDLGYRKP